MGEVIEVMKWLVNEVWFWGSLIVLEVAFFAWLKKRGDQALRNRVSSTLERQSSEVRKEVKEAIIEVVDGVSMRMDLTDEKIEDARSELMSVLEKLGGGILKIWNAIAGRLRNRG